MEAVHKPSNRAWIDDDIINVRQFLEDWKKVLISEIDDSTTDSSSLKSLLSENEYLAIENDCGLEALKHPHQDKVEPATRITVPNSVSLETIRLQAEDLKRREEDKHYASTVYNTLKYLNYPPHKVINSISNSEINHNPVATPEVVLSVLMFVPERRMDSKTTVVVSKLPTFQIDQEMLVLGSQYLTELRDKIDCMSDRVFPGECSDCPTVEQTTSCKDLYKSGFFYINGVFYNDMRDKNCRDYSDIIVKWAAKDNRGIGPFKKALMEKTKFIELNIQLGYPYVYTHQGDCEHIFVFSDLRMFSKHHDIDNKNAYPVYVHVKPSKRVFCMICHAYTASWVVYDNKRLPECPFFFCKQCYLNFNYTATNEKIGDFRSYHFPDNTKLK